ncbi:hypothetical protein KPL70_011537 [Citrus sinensis]|nr:hypothetical protein KPL70_011537 [Citrus sinensis]
MLRGSVVSPLFVTWKKVVNGGEPRLRGCIGTLEARCLINGFKDYALTSALKDRRFPPIQARELPSLECTVSILTDFETANNYLDWEDKMGRGGSGFPLPPLPIGVGIPLPTPKLGGTHGFPLPLPPFLRDGVYSVMLEVVKLGVSIRRVMKSRISASLWQLSKPVWVGTHGLIIEFTDPEYSTRRSATYLPEVAAHEGWTKVEAIDSLMRKAGFSGPITESLRKRIRLTRYQSTLFALHYSDYASYVKTTRGAAPSILGAKPGNY